MIDIQDLQVERDILPLFDYTLNSYAKRYLLTLFNEPLSSVDAVQERQQVLKGFIENHPVLEDYSYSSIYFSTAYELMNHQKGIADLPSTVIKYKLFFSKKEREHHRSLLAQVFLLLHRIDTLYLSKLAPASFPESFQSDMGDLRAFIQEMDVYAYADLLKRGGLSDFHILEASSLLQAQIDRNRVSSFWQGLLMFEAYYSMSLGIRKYGYVFPVVGGEKLSLRGLYHPLLPNGVRNDFETGFGVVLLNGPNMSGKSTFLKAISICIYLGHLGLGIPAEEGSIPFFSGFSVVLNHRDDLRSGYSHFMKEIKGLKRVVLYAHQKPAFAVFDELFNGTNASDAFDILRTTIQGLSQYESSLFFISTHVQGLKKVESKGIAKYHIGCDMEEGKPKFTYKLHHGWSDLKVGQLLFEQEGMYALLNRDQ